jgi:hypothetical protein
VPQVRRASQHAVLRGADALRVQPAARGGRQPAVQRRRAAPEGGDGVGDRRAQAGVGRLGARGVESGDGGAERRAGGALLDGHRDAVLDGQRVPSGRGDAARAAGGVHDHRELGDERVHHVEGVEVRVEDQAPAGSTYATPTRSLALKAICAL